MLAAAVRVARCLLPLYELLFGPQAPNSTHGGSWGGLPQSTQRRSLCCGDIRVLLLELPCYTESCCSYVCKASMHTMQSGVLLDSPYVLLFLNPCVKHSQHVTTVAQAAMRATTIARGIAIEAPAYSCGVITRASAATFYDLLRPPH